MGTHAATCDRVVLVLKDLEEKQLICQNYNLTSTDSQVNLNCNWV